MDSKDLEGLGHEVLAIYGNVCNRVLRMAEAALPAPQFKAFRRLVLDEFGEQGAQKQIKRLFGMCVGNGVVWKGRDDGVERAGASANTCKGGAEHE